MGFGSRAALLTLPQNRWSVGVGRGVGVRACACAGMRVCITHLALASAAVRLSELARDSADMCSLKFRPRPDAAELRGEPPDTAVMALATACSDRTRAGISVKGEQNTVRRATWQPSG